MTRTRAEIAREFANLESGIGSFFDEITNKHVTFAKDDGDSLDSATMYLAVQLGVRHKRGEPIDLIQPELEVLIKRGHLLGEADPYKDIVRWFRKGFKEA